jgi:hypothetical protein
MKRIAYLFTAYFCMNSSLYAQKSALDYLNNAPKPPVTPCACTKAIYNKYADMLDSYCDKIQADIEAREKKAIKNDLSGNLEYKNLLETVINEVQIPALKFYCLDNVCDEYPELLNEAERKTVANDLQICTLLAQKRMNILLHRSSEKEKPGWIKEADEAQDDYCRIMSPKYKTVLDGYYDILIRLMPSFKRMGELEYSGSQPATDIPVINAVRAYLSQYALRYYCGNLKIK